MLSFGFFALAAFWGIVLALDPSLQQRDLYAMSKTRKLCVSSGCICIREPEIDVKTPYQRGQRDNQENARLDQHTATNRAYHEALAAYRALSPNELDADIATMNRRTAPRESAQRSKQLRRQLEVSRQKHYRQAMKTYLDESRKYQVLTDKDGSLPAAFAVPPELSEPLWDGVEMREPKEMPGFVRSSKEELRHADRRRVTTARCARKHKCLLREGECWPEQRLQGGVELLYE